ncbi:hypothetical protein GGR57DRAFT_490046 [Xylariaceae sp. FL1272]|nr:hypothetical protein GGR57DRAFT_490046 [Xylariaceae sp. FL1272]
MLLLPRNDLLNVLYQHLPGKDTAIKLGAEVVDYKVSDHGVCVHLKDDTTVEGSIVVGADGVHSRVRKTMELMQRKDTPCAPETQMTANYKSIYAIGPNKQGIEDGLSIEMRGSGVAANLVTSPTRLLAIFYRREMDSFAESFMDFTVAPGILFRDIWGDFYKTSARLVNQEEGVAQSWHYRRLVLLGDSAHKMTSASGLGVNVGLHSATLLANELLKCLLSNAAPGTDVLNKVFERWQVELRECQRLATFGYTIVRTITWESWSYWIFDRFISRLISIDKVMAASIYPMISNRQILSYVPFEGKSAIVPWHRWPDVKL